VNHRASPSFWSLYERLKPEVRRLADKNFELLRRDPNHPSLHFKRVGRYWSVRVGLNLRALGVRRGEDLVWFWIGTHDDYERLLG
jgi:hypothetical protein